MKANGSRVWNPEAASITLRNWAFASSFLPWLFKEKGGRCDPAKVNSSVKSSSVQKSVQKIPKSVFLFDDRIEVLSYGSLPFNMSEEDFYAGKSRPVNRSLFEIFALSSLAEQSGHGVPLIVERYGKKAFDFSSGTIVVTIPFAFVPEPIKIQRYFSAKGPTGREIENQVLLYFLEQSTASMRECASSLGVSESYVKKTVESLRMQGKLKRYGSRKGGSWIV